MRLQTRLAVLFGAVATAAAVLMGILSYAAMRERLMAQVDESLRAVSGPLAEDLARGRPASDLLGTDGRDERSRRDSSGLVLPTQLLLPTGTVVISGTSALALPVADADIAVARSATPATRFRDAAVDGAPLRMVTQTDGGSRGAVQVGRDVSENQEVLTSLAWLLTAIGAGVAALAAGAGWLVARRSAARLVELTDAAEVVTHTGRLDVAVPEQGSDEISRLGASFNAMLMRLSQSRDDQQRLVEDAGHELRTPLTSLRTNVSLLRSFDAMPPATRERVIADLDGETRELTHLVNEVVHLASAAPAEGQSEPIDLAELAQSAASRAYRRTGREVRLRTDGSTVRGTPAAIERAIWNLVDNACKFSPADQPVELVVEQGAVLVRDGGPGIDDVDLPHVFDRFYRATAARSLPGSGLGLAIVRDVAETHGGQVHARTLPEGGAELGFRLPLAEPVEAPGPGSGSGDA